MEGLLNRLGILSAQEERKMVEHVVDRIKEFDCIRFCFGHNHYFLVVIEQSIPENERLCDRRDTSLSAFIRCYQTV